MISAFGIDHGNISKGLPSALRSGVSSTKYGQAKIAINSVGRELSRNPKSIVRNQNGTVKIERSVKTSMSHLKNKAGRAEGKIGTGPVSQKTAVKYNQVIEQAGKKHGLRFWPITHRGNLQNAGKNATVDTKRSAVRHMNYTRRALNDEIARNSVKPPIQQSKPAW
jgi:hypothetical protein